MRRGKGAFVLVEVLVLVACLVALMAMLAADQRESMQAAQSRLRRERADFAARSAVALAVATLEEADSNLVTLADTWATLGDLGNAQYTVGNATFRLEIVDAGAMIDVNYAPEEQLNLLPIDDEMRDCLLDWREGDSLPRASGAKDGYYNSLTPPYNARRGTIQTIDELLLVKGWTARRLYTTLDEDVRTGVSLDDDSGNAIPLARVFTTDSGAPNTRADGTTRSNVGSGQLSPAFFMQMGADPMLAQRLAQAGPYSSFQQLLSTPGVSTDMAQQLLDSVTFTNSTRLHGKMNANTASQAVLMTLPNMTSDIAANIVSRQSAGLASLGELATIPGLEGSLLGEIADRLVVGSDVWIIRAYGSSGGQGQAVEVVVRKDSDRVRVITWQRAPGSAAPAWWGWNQDATYSTTVGST
ncbi:MAG: type II secretion system protein GspK [Armatimonadetes bacterium]|nr:type II secretion system protein GspK [Armatimonadota bacterium]